MSNPSNDHLRPDSWHTPDSGVYEQQRYRVDSQISLRSELPATKPREKSTDSLATTPSDHFTCLGQRKRKPAGTSPNASNVNLNPSCARTARQTVQQTLPSPASSEGRVSNEIHLVRRRQHSRRNVESQETDRDGCTLNFYFFLPQVTTHGISQSTCSGLVI